MIEKFTTEELEIIKRELGVTTFVDDKKKKNALIEQRTRIQSVFEARISGNRNGSNSYVFPAKDIESAIIMICDHIHKNYNEKTCGGKIRRSNSIEGCVDSYKRDFDKILDLAIELLEEKKDGGVDGGV